LEVPVKGIAQLFEGIPKELDDQQAQMPGKELGVFQSVKNPVDQCLSERYQ
jgi:hypothetical protein